MKKLPRPLALRICDEYRTGKTMGEVARTLSISPTTVRRCLKRKGIAIRQKPPADGKLPVDERLKILTQRQTNLRLNKAGIRNNYNIQMLKKNKAILAEVIQELFGRAK